MHVGLLEEARREIDEALRLNPANTLAQFRTGVVSLYEGQYSQAVENLQWQTPPTFQPPLRSFQLADSLFHVGRKVEARDVVESYVRANPRDTGGMNTAFLALLAADCGRSRPARDLAKKAQGKRPRVRALSPHRIHHSGAPSPSPGAPTPRSSGCATPPTMGIRAFRVRKRPRTGPGARDASCSRHFSLSSASGGSNSESSPN
jgi:hypothetical protein